MRSPDALYLRGNKYFGGYEPYGITVAGNTIVIVRNTADLASVWKDTTGLSYDPFVTRVLLSFGISKHNVERIYLPDPGRLIKAGNRDDSLLLNSNPRKKCYMHVQSEWFKEQLLPGERLIGLQESNLGYLQEAVDLNHFDSDFVMHSAAKSQLQASTVSLQKYIRSILSRCALRTFFGDELFEVEPNFARLYQKWEDDSWKVFFGYPRFLIEDLHTARLQAMDGLIKYYKLPLGSRPKMSWLFGTLDRELGHLELNETDRAGIVMMIVWAINNNAHQICFWMLAHMLCDPDLFNSVRTELDSCCALDGSWDVDKLITDCPHLDAIWNETLRLYDGATTVRKAVRECRIGGKVIHSGDQVFGPARNFHFEPNLFGQSPFEFDAERFLNDKNLPRSRGFIPFGGGHTYCPGRYFAQREIYMLLALTLDRFELQVTDTEGIPVSRPQVPPVQRSMPASTAVGPANDLYVTLRQRRAKA